MAEKYPNERNDKPEFDFIFVDSDKPNYMKYHEYLKKFVK
ncbi:O-methyltransferase, family 3, partial [Corchorus capsularis]